MRGDVTVSVKSILLAGLVGLALVTAYLLGGQADAVNVPANSAPGEPGVKADRLMVSMVGTGEASAVPDQISFTMTASCLLYTSPSPRDLSTSRMPSSA